MKSCEGCLFYHPERKKRRCSILPRMNVETTPGCGVRMPAPDENTLALRVRTKDDLPERR